MVAGPGQWTRLFDLLWGIFFWTLLIGTIAAFLVRLILGRLRKMPRLVHRIAPRTVARAESLRQLCVDLAWLGLVLLGNVIIFAIWMHGEFSSVFTFGQPTSRAHEPITFHIMMTIFSLGGLVFLADMILFITISARGARRGSRYMSALESESLAGYPGDYKFESDLGIGTIQSTLNTAGPWTWGSFDSDSPGSYLSSHVRLRPGESPPSRWDDTFPFMWKFRIAGDEPKVNGPAYTIRVGHWQDLPGSVLTCEQAHEIVQKKILPAIGARNIKAINWIDRLKDR